MEEDDPDLLASALEVLEISEVARLAVRGASTFTEAELAYAHSKSDPERRLAARLAAKRAALRLLGEDLPLNGIEVLKGQGGPPQLRLSRQASDRLVERGARQALVSLTHSQHHAAATVVLLRGGR
jgi:holo-[acyl-carrier protein] synthase